MKFIIRDDDLSYYTDIEQIKMLYEPLFARGFKVSFATIPRERRVEHKENRSLYKQYDEYGWIGDNSKLVEYIRTKVIAGSAEVMQHGFDHAYHITTARVFVGECIQKSREALKKDLKCGKQHLEHVFGEEVVSFVPPSNQIDAKTTATLKEIGIRFLSGTILPQFNRELSISNFFNWMLSCIYRLMKGHRFPYPMQNDTLLETTYYSLTTLSELKGHFDYCARHDAPFVLAVHYWDIIENMEKRSVWEHFLSYVESSGAEKVLFKELSI